MRRQANLWTVVQQFGKEDEMEQLLTVAEAAKILGTTDRFPRRLISQRRIKFVRVGRHVRIPERALEEFIAAGAVEPAVVDPGWGSVA